MCLVKTACRFSVLCNHFAVLTRGLALVELTNRNVYCEETGHGGQKWQFFWKLLYVVRSSAHMAYVKAG
jgi:hypothetical protein